MLTWQVPLVSWGRTSPGTDSVEEGAGTEFPYGSAQRSFGQTGFPPEHHALSGTP